MDKPHVKITYHMGTKKMNAYLMNFSRVFHLLKKEIEICLFQERKQTLCQIRIFWIDDEKDEIEIVNQCDYDIFLERTRRTRSHLQVAPVGMDIEEPGAAATNKPVDSSANQTTMPPTAGSFDLAVHENIECDSCLMAPIIGFRYKCIQCTNYDICQNCESKQKHSEHMMVRMPTNNCPNVIESYITGRNPSRKHGKRSKTSFPLFKNGLSAIINDDIIGLTTSAADKENSEQPSSGNGKERHHGRKHHRHQQRNSFFSHLYEIMNDLAEGGGADAAACAMGESANVDSKAKGFVNEKNPTAADAAAAANKAAEHAHDAAMKAAGIALETAINGGKNMSGIVKTFASGITTSDAATECQGFENEKPPTAADVAAAANKAAQHAHDAAAKVAEISAKVAHETALNATKNIYENIKTFSTTSTTSDAATDFLATEVKIAKEKVNGTATPPKAEPQTNTVPVIPSPSLESLVQYLDPQYMKSGIQILNNFSDMLAKMLDPQPGSNQTNSSNFNSLATEKKSDKEISTEHSSIEKPEEKQTVSDVSSHVAVEDLNSESENESVTDSFVKLNVPKYNEEHLSKRPSNTSADTTPPKSLDKLNVFYLSEDDDERPYDAQEATEESSLIIQNNEDTTNNPTTSAETPVTSTNSSSVSSINDTPDKKQVYHTDQRINSAVLSMMSMGFSNEGAWLTKLLESVNGNIMDALDVMSSTQRGRGN